MAREKGASGEKVIWLPRGMSGGGNWEGSGTMFYGRICLKCEGELQFYPAFRLLRLDQCTEGRG